MALVDLDTDTWQGDYTAAERLHRWVLVPPAAWIPPGHLATWPPGHLATWPPGACWSFGHLTT